MEMRKLAPPQNKTQILLMIVIAIFPLWVLEWGPLNVGLPTEDIIKPIDSSNQKLNVDVGPLNILIPSLPVPIVEKFIIGKGDTMIGLFLRGGLAPKLAHRAIRSLRQIYDPKAILPGQELEFSYSTTSSAGGKFVQTKRGQLKTITYRPDLFQEYVINLNDENNFSAKLYKQAIKTILKSVAGTIKFSLYVSAIRSGLPLPILMELIRIYSWDVDFQRSIREGDKFELLYESKVTTTGQLARYGDIIYAKLKLGKNQYPLYRFRNKNGVYHYFDHKGHSARKALMRTPINGARLSSGFGTRRHPILGYNKMHRGVDFAAPRGTPIFAAGSGIIVFRSRNGSYGNYIRIRHNSEYSTAYGHLSKFKRSLTKGSRVRQGQIIGFVGTTGRSTGAHLHYEILRRGRQTNPMRVKMPSGKHLTGRDLKKFRKIKETADKLFQNHSMANKPSRDVKFPISKD